MVVMMAPWILMEVTNDGLAKQENKEELVIQPYEPWEKLSSPVSGRCCEKNVSDPEKKYSICTSDPADVRFSAADWQNRQNSAAV